MEADVTERTDMETDVIHAIAEAMDPPTGRWGGQNRRTLERAGVVYDQCVRPITARVDVLEAALRDAEAITTEVANDERHTTGERAGARIVGALIRKRLATPAGTEEKDEGGADVGT